MLQWCSKSQTQQPKLEHEAHAMNKVIIQNIFAVPLSVMEISKLVWDERSMCTERREWWGRTNGGIAHGLRTSYSEPASAV